MDNKMNCKIPDPRGNFRKVVIPAAMGDDSGEFAPQNGAYHDALVKYEANGAIYIYSSDGIPTKISNTIDGLKALAFKDKADYDEDIINKPEIPAKTSDLLNDSGFITSEYHDASKQDALTAGDNITIENNVISATGGGSSYELVNEIIEGDNAGLVLGDLDLTTYDGGGLMFIKNTEDEETSRSLGAFGIDYMEMAANSIEFEGADGARFGGNNGWIAFDDGEVRIGSEGRDIILQPEGNTGKKVYYRDDNVMTYTADDEVATVGYVNEHAGGGTPVEAGKGIEVEEYALLSVTVEVSGQLPPDYMGTLPLTLNLSDIKPGTNMYDLFTEGKLDYEDLFYWDTMYEVTTSGLDSEVVELAELTIGAYVLQFNGAGTTSGTVTATRGAESYTANIAITITAGDNTAYISEGKHMLPASLLMAFLELSYGDVVDDPEELLELFENQDNVDSFIAAIKKRYKFYASADGISINFQTLMYDEYGIVLLMQSGGDFDSAIISIRFEDGEAVSLSKNAIISTFTEDSDGLVPKPGYSQASSKYLRGNGTWQTLNTYALTLTLEDDTTVTLNLKGE